MLNGVKHLIADKYSVDALVVIDPSLSLRMTKIRVAFQQKKDG